MSTLETTIWYILGYITMPLIFIFGFAATALVGCFILEKFEQSSIRHSSEGTTE